MFIDVLRYNLLGRGEHPQSWAVLSCVALHLEQAQAGANFSIAQVLVDRLLRSKQHSSFCCETCDRALRSCVLWGRSLRWCLHERHGPVTERTC